MNEISRNPFALQWRSAPTPLVWLLSELILGVAPTFLFLVWIERNLSLPVLPTELGWPWLDLLSAPTFGRALFDLTLACLWALLFSGLGRSLFLKLAIRIIPLHRIKTLQITLSGILFFMLMGLWQPTGVIVWSWLPTANAGFFLSAVPFWLILAVAFFLVDQRRLRGLLALALFASPMMSLDRLLLSFGYFAYLAWEAQKAPESSQKI